MPLRLACRVRLLDRAAAPLKIAVANGAVEVEAAGNPDRRVHAETSELTARPAKTPLQEVVHQALRHSEVVESAVESTLADVGKDLPPAGRDGLQHVAVEDVVVEEEHLLVEPLPRVVVVGDVLLRVGDRRL